MSLELVELGTACLFESGFKSLENDLAGIRRRIARGRERADDRADLEACELALAELRALWRATIRAELELDDDAGPLDRALIDVDELIRAGLTLRTIPPETRDALRRDREADYALVLYGFADSGGDSATT